MVKTISFLILAELNFFVTQASLNLSDKKAIKQNIDITPLVMGLSYFHPLSPAIIAYLQKHTIAVTIRKKKLLLKAGQMCDYVYFITKGAVRGYIKEGSKDITTWISVENELVTSISSLDIKAPSIENMQAIEDCEMLALSYIDLENLYTKYIDANIAGRKLLQKYYRDAEGRAFIARLTKAENKYNYFLENHSHLSNRIPLKYIASFLGITQETLSRVRKKLQTK